METVNVRIPKEFEKKVKAYLQKLEKRREILKKNRGDTKNGEICERPQGGGL